MYCSGLWLLLLCGCVAIGVGFDVVVYCWLMLFVDGLVYCELVNSVVLRIVLMACCVWLVL